MAINIKEIFEGDAPNQQIDKINYNFDQILANGGGPIGATGAQGVAGSVGATGAQGAQGPIGPQGVPGAYSDFFVSNDIDPGVDGSNTIAPSARNNRVPSLVLGDAQASSNGSVSLYDSSALRIIGSRFNGNLVRLDVDGLNTNYIDINLNEGPNGRVLKFDNSAQGSDAIYEFDGKSLSLNYNNNDIIKLAYGGSFFEVPVDFEDQVNFNQETVFNALTRLPNNAAAGKVLSSTDSAGTFSWTDPGVVPIGTIVMAPGFVLANSVDTQGNTSPLALDNWIGRGTGDWAGWYYCNGETWLDSGVSYDVPDMRDRLPLGFSYLQNADSTASKTPNLESGAKNVEQLESVQTADDHTHTVPGTNYGIGGGSGNNNVTWLSNYTTSSEGAKTVNISPKTTTVGYMIYLEKTTLKYTIGASANNVSSSNGNIQFGNGG